MSNIELQRDHNGVLHLFVAGVPAHGAQVTGIGPNSQGEPVAIVQIPTKHLTLAEQRNVIPFVRPQAA